MSTLRTRLQALLATCGVILLIDAGSPVKVPYSTNVSVHIKSQLSSATAKVGDPVPIEVADDVAVNGYIVFSKGADGLAEVSSVTPAAANTAGQVQIAFKWVHCVDGSKIGITGQQNSTSPTSTPAASGPTASDLQNAVNSAGVNSSLVSQANNYLGRATSVFGTLNAHAKGSEGSIEPDRKMIASVRNPLGVTVESTLKSTASDDSDVK